MKLNLFHYHLLLLAAHKWLLIHVLSNDLSLLSRESNFELNSSNFPMATGWMGIRGASKATSICCSARDLLSHYDLFNIPLRCACLHFSDENNETQSLHLMPKVNGQYQLAQWVVLRIIMCYQIYNYELQYLVYWIIFFSEKNYKDWQQPIATLLCVCVCMHLCTRA